MFQFDNFLWIERSHIINISGAIQFGDTKPNYLKSCQLHVWWINLSKLFQPVPKLSDLSCWSEVEGSANRMNTTTKTGSKVMQLMISLKVKYHKGLVVPSF